MGIHFGLEPLIRCLTLSVVAATLGMSGCGGAGTGESSGAGGASGGSSSGEGAAGSEADAAAWDIHQQNARLGAGINIGNCLDAPNEGDWGHVLELEDFDYAKEWGFSHIRLPIRWNAHASPKPPYAIESAFFERVDWAIAQAFKRELRVVIDVHHFDELNADREGYHEQLFGIWEQIASHYAKYGPELYFELYNEPLADFPAADWNQWVAELVTTVRESNPERAIIIGGVNFSNIDGLEALVLPKDDHLIATYHFYDPITFVYQGAGDWVPGSEDWLGTKWYGSEAEVAELDEAFARVETWQARNGGVPIYLGEWGTTRAGDLDSRVRYTAFIAESCNERDFSWAIWDMHTELGLHDEATDTVTTDLVDALRDPSATFAATRTTPPLAEIPAGPSVLVDDFENAFSDRGDQSHLTSAQAASLGVANEQAQWYVTASADSSWTGSGGTPMVTVEQSAATGTPTNFSEALELQGAESGTIALALDGQLGSSATAHLGLGVLLSQAYTTDFVDLCKLSAISFRAQGTGTLNVSLVTNDVINGYAEGSNWGHFAADTRLTKDWTQHVVLAETLRPRPWSPAADDSLLWVDACDQVSAVQILSTSGQSSLRLDDLRLHGVDYDAFGFSYTNPIP